MIRLQPQRFLLLILLSFALFGTGMPIGAPAQPRPASIPGQPSRGPRAPDTAAVAQTVEQFYDALVSGDSTAVARLLHPDAVILEGGHRETRMQYLGHHFHSDHAFLSALDRETESRRIRVEGNTAWVSSTARLHGTYNDRSYDLTTVGLLVLSQTDGAWRIRAIHWSSRSRE